MYTFDIINAEEAARPVIARIHSEIPREQLGRILRGGMAVFEDVPQEKPAPAVVPEPALVAEPVTPVPVEVPVPAIPAVPATASQSRKKNR